MPQKEFKWYALRAVSGKEVQLKEYIKRVLNNNEELSRNVKSALVPMEKHVELRNGKRVVREKILLAGYVFVEARLVGDTPHALRFMPNCLGFLGGLDSPTPIPVEQVNRLLGAAEATEDSEIEIPYIAGESVKVTDGPFSGFVGTIEKVDSTTHKLSVVVKIFGRNTPLELDYTQVEKLGDSEE